MIQTSAENRAIPGDLFAMRSHTLTNGLRLLMSVNPEEPRIFTNIAFRAGSKHDPADTTGLAHYMEHMLFKGTSRIGALDWEQEEKLLDRIAGLYEQHRHSADPEERRRLYQEIDRLSFEAAKLAAPNEYDKLAAALGARATNAYTWLEQTVYVNDIPSNELERWLRLESERFRLLALRLFHTELETVYEEFNINQDRDFRKANQALREALFPQHPYGTQTTIGSAEHLRNPSMVNIQRFFQSYYVANNMAIILAGDFDPDEAIRLVERYFGHYPPRKIPPFTFPEQPPITQPIRQTVSGKEAPYLMLGWRLGGAHSDEALLSTLLRQILFNEQAGLLDIELNQRQRVLDSEAWCWHNADYTVFGLYGRAREGQSLEEVERLLLEQLDRARRGEIPEWLREAAINNLRVLDIHNSESNASRTQTMTQMYILGVDWERFVNRLRWMAGIDTPTLAEWTRERLRDDNYAVVYKLQGDDPNVVKVNKPPITPVELRREAISSFAYEFLQQTPSPPAPVFADFQRDIQRLPLLPGLSLDYVRNPGNSLFKLEYIFEIGKMHDRRLGLAIAYLPYLGAGPYSAERLHQELYRLGLSFEANIDHRHTHLVLQGLDESMDEGLTLMEMLLSEARADEAALRNVVSDILVKREHAKRNRDYILRQALANYGKYGPDSPFRHRLSAQELRAAEAATLVDLIKGLSAYPHDIHYYGPKPVEAAAERLRRARRAPNAFSPLPAPEKHFEQLPTTSPQVLFVDFPIVQTDILMLSKGRPRFDLDEHIMAKWYNDYFGGGLSSIVFQEIRESKALAYSTYAHYSSPARHDEAHYLQAYVGTQPDKVPDAVSALVDIIEHMPAAPDQIETSRISILRQIESERIPPRKLYWAARSVWDLGLNHDLRQDIHRRLQAERHQALLDFHHRAVRGRAFTFLVLGAKNSLEWSFLQSIGQIRELSMDDIFGP